MMKSFKMIGVAGLMAGALIVAGCGSDNGTTTTTTAATTTTTAATTTTTAVPTTTTTTLPPVINVSAAGTTDASTAAFTFNVHPVSTFTYTIAGFAAGDKLVFDAGSAIGLNNVSGTDGIIDVTGTLNGNAVTIHLTGIALASDAAIYGVNSFNTVFGAGSLQ